jgi:hypothetical protein
MGGLNDGPTADVFFISTIILKQVLRNYRLYLRGSKGEAIDNLHAFPLFSSFDFG